MQFFSRPVDQTWRAQLRKCVACSSPAWYY
uniref:Uncharacterized protein n=1 Tax=Anguilla anguilla TaxID=7936 RepID=A0A0E9VQ19_ANGAN